MIGIAFLISIFTQFAPQNVWHIQEGPAELSVEFQEINTIKVGSAVIAEGELIGNVSSISPIAATATGLDQENGGYAVRLKITPHHRAILRKGTVALIKTPFSTTRKNPETVLELLIPHDVTSPALIEGDTLVGYSSFQEFWSADFSKRGIDNNAFKLASADA